MSIHVCKCDYNGSLEYHLRYPGMPEEAAQELADKINAGALENVKTVFEVPEDSWPKVHSVEELRNFFRSRLPAIREAARALGYAIGVHGSERRDFDLMAMQWRDDPAPIEEFAHAIARAACGITRSGKYDWTIKPAGRKAVSLPICWPEWGDHKTPSLGHIDLSVIDPYPEAT
jgi:hypothetical protein